MTEPAMPASTCGIFNATGQMRLKNRSKWCVITISGGGNELGGTRTLDLAIKSRLLYQLSYQLGTSRHYLTGNSRRGDNSA